MSIIINIKEFQGKPLGFSEDYELDSDVNLEGIVLDSPIKGAVQVTTLDKDIGVGLSNITANAIHTCAKCLEQYTTSVHIPSATREYLFEEPAIVDDPHELFLIDLKNQEICLDEMLRQEIILHFPLISVCSDSCKGICQTCGANLNKICCDCKGSEENEDFHPLAALKDLLK